MAWLSSASAHMQEEPGLGQLGDDGRDRNAIKFIQYQPREAFFSTKDVCAGNSGRVAVSKLPWEATTKSLIISQMKAHFLPVKDGIMDLLKECLIAEDATKFAVLCGHVDHFESPNDDDLGWDCGWRNIQMLSSFLIAEDAEASKVVFGGAKFVPDVTALQRWLEIAWSEGFDVSGAEYFNWRISGTMKWIGTTECASLLRSFGVRTKVVSFSGIRSKGEARRTAGSSVQPSTDNRTPPKSETSRGSDIPHDDDRNLREETPARKLQGEHKRINRDDPSSDEGVVDIRGFPDGCGLRRSRGKTETHAEAKNDDTEKEREEEPKGREVEEWLRNISLGASGFDGSTKLSTPEIMCQRQMTSKVLCYKRLNEAGEHSFVGTDSPRDYIFIEECPSPRLPKEWVEEKQNSGQCNGEAKQKAGLVTGECDGTGQESTNFKMGNFQDNFKGGWRQPRRTVSQLDEENGEYRKIFEEQVVVDEDKLCASLFPEVFSKKGGMMRLSNPRRYSFKHDHLVAWIWRYFTQDSEKESISSHHCVIGSKRSPIYFQHQGHSRTIIGIERLSHAGRSEDVFLLILDPSHPSDLLLKTLRDNNGWQKLVKYNVKDLQEADYQLCYVNPGIAAGDELAQMKILTSLKYSYFS